MTIFSHLLERLQNQTVPVDRSIPPGLRAEVARIGPDAPERARADWPHARAHAGRWWGGRRGERIWAYQARIAICDHMTSLAPEVYVYFDSTHDAPSADFDTRWEAVACALEDAAYADANRHRLSASRYADLRKHWASLIAEDRTNSGPSDPSVTRSRTATIRE